jgi:hypothetical protein
MFLQFNFMRLFNLSPSPDNSIHDLWVSLAIQQQRRRHIRAVFLISSLSRALSGSQSSFILREYLNEHALFHRQPIPTLWVFQ